MKNKKTVIILFFALIIPAVLLFFSICSMFCLNRIEKYVYNSSYYQTDLKNLQKSVYLMKNFMSFSSNKAIPMNSEIAMGNGFVIEIGRKKFILTKFHLYKTSVDEDKQKFIYDIGEPTGNITIEFQTFLLRGNKKYKTKGIVVNPALDYALLKLEKTDFKLAEPIAIGNSRELKIGDIVYMLYPDNKNDFIYKKGVIKGFINSVKGLQDDLIILEGAMDFGDSGSPIIKIEKDGGLRVVGIFSRKLPNEYGGKAVSINHIIKDIQNYL